MANGIIAAQVREIKEMEWLIEDIRTNGIVENADSRPAPEFSGALE